MITGENEGVLDMQLARFFGILVVFGAPAIIGGGLVYHLFHHWLPVWVYEAALVAFAFRTAFKVCSKPVAEHEH